MEETKVSRRGVYKDLNLSPYVYESPYGDSFKFRSQKRLDMYRRDVKQEIERVTKFFDRSGLSEFIPDEIVRMIYRYTYWAFYSKQEG